MVGTRRGKERGLTRWRFQRGSVRAVSLSRISCHVNHSNLLPVAVQLLELGRLVQASNTESSRSYS